MCRWFAYISGDEPCLLADILIRPDNSIVKQVEKRHLPGILGGFEGTEEEIPAFIKEIEKRNMYFNNDGTGIAHYNKSQKEYGDAECRMPQVYKTIMAPENDINFESLCENTTSRTVFAHVRKATSQVQQYNSHPFVFGRHIFMHNGTVADFNLIRRALCAKLSPEAYENVKGTTDSEHVAALYFTYLAETVKDQESANKKVTSQEVPGQEVPDQKPRVKEWDRAYTLEQMRDSLKRAVATVIQLQRDALKLGPGAEVPPSSLNFCTTDGEQLLAFRYRNHVKQQPPSLYYSTRAGVELNRKYPRHPNYLPGQDPGKAARGFTDGRHSPGEYIEKHIIVASDATTKQEDGLWQPIGKNKAVLVKFDADKRVNLRLEDIEWDL